MGAEVSGIQLYERVSAEAADRAEGLERFKGRVRELRSRTRGVSTERMAEDLIRYLRGWLGYFRKCETPSVLEGLEQWFRRRRRSAIWKQWKRGSVRFAELRKRGLKKDLAAQTAGSSHGPWRLADSPGLHIALPNAHFDSLGIPRLTVRNQLNSPNRRMRIRTSGGVGGEKPRGFPYPDSGMIGRGAAQLPGVTLIARLAGDAAGQ